jgi:hypothetical protein
MIWRVAFLPFIAVTCFAADPIQIGDADGDGKVDGKDARVLYDILYNGKQVPPEQLAALDINGDGKVDIDDLVDMNEHWHDKIPFPKRPAPERPPRVMPRYAQQAWWVGDDSKPAAAFKVRLKKFSDDFSGNNISRALVERWEQLKRDLDAAEYYGLICGDNLREFRRKVFWAEPGSYSRKRLDDWLAKPAVGSNYVTGCARKLGQGERKLSISAGSISDVCVVHEIIPYIYVKESSKFYVQGSPSGRMTLRFPFSFKFAEDFNSSDQQSFDQWWNGCTAVIKDYWTRYGIDFQFDSSDRDPNEFMIHSGKTRSDSSNLFLGDMTAMPGAECSPLLHEISHRLGLPDRYAEKGIKCPSRKPEEESENEIMAKGAHVSIFEAVHSPEDLQGIFESLCGNYVN